MTTTITPSVVSFVDLARQLSARFDTDKDGKLSTDEFTALLGQMMGTLAPSASAASSATGASAFAAPAATAVTAPAADRKPVGIMGGFDPVKLANLSHNTLKYDIGRILQFHPNTPEGLRAALPEIQKVVPEAKIAPGKGDRIDFGEFVFEGTRIGVVDVIFAAAEGGKSWQWGAE